MQKKKKYQYHNRSCRANQHTHTCAVERCGGWVEAPRYIEAVYYAIQSVNVDP